MTQVLLVTSNGTGMGHLTRQAAIALALQPEHEPSILTLSPAAPVVAPLGISVEYCPSYDRPWIAGTDWDWYLRDRLVTLVDELGARAVVFDGVAPYQGIGMAARRLGDVAFVWLRRGLWKPGTGRQHLARSSYFDLIIEPGDLAGKVDAGQHAQRGDASSVGPISMLEVVDSVSRFEARAALGLPQEPRIALVTLGSGMLGEVVGPGQIAIDTILRQSTWHVAVTKSSVATSAVPLGESRRVHELEGVYPLVRYLNAFDAAVSSAGYNAVHELIPAGLPVALVANTSTRTDDQTLRAKRVASKGLALAAEDSELDSVEEVVELLMRDDFRDGLALKAGSTRGLVTGASEVARMVIEFGASFDRSRTTNPVSNDLWEFTKALAARALGERVVRWLRWLLRRSSSRPGSRTKVRIGSPADKADGALPLIIGEDFPADQAIRDTPFEHLISGSSSSYVALRHELVASYYDLRV